MAAHLPAGDGKMDPYVPAFFQRNQHYGNLCRWAGLNHSTSPGIPGRRNHPQKVEKITGPGFVFRDPGPKKKAGLQTYVDIDMLAKAP